MACDGEFSDGFCETDKDWGSDLAEAKRAIAISHISLANKSSTESSIINNQEVTVFQKAVTGDFQAITNLIKPSHIGGRGEFFVCFGVCVGIGTNIIYNFNDNKAAISIDTSGGGGPAPKQVMPKLGVFASFGPLIGWESSSIEDSTTGTSAQVNGFAAAGLGLTVSVSTPVDVNTSTQFVKGDPVYGQAPFTMYIGLGAGIGAGAGVGLSQTIQRTVILQ
jgi:hypothetical protein